MKTLKDYIGEASLLDIEGTLDSGEKDIKKLVKTWIKDNFEVVYLKISKKPNRDGKYVVSAKNARVINKNIKSLVNEFFIWDVILVDFDCSYCDNLISLEGAPKEVGGFFDCSHCKQLKSLKGSPEEIDGDFYCFNCDSLTSLEGAPNNIGCDFSCNYCKSLKTLKGAPKEVGGNFCCSGCKSLVSVDDAPNKIGKYIYFYNCISLNHESIPERIKNKTYKISLQ